MNRTSLRKLYLPAFIIFILINALAVVFAKKLQQNDIDSSVIIGANSLLFVLALISAYMHAKAATNSNPNAFVRSVMGATVLKLFVIAGAAFIYLFAAGANKSVKALLTAMVLYLIYTIIEVRTAFAINRKKDGLH